MIKLIDILREGMASDKHPTNSNEENFKKLLNRLSDGEKKHYELLWNEASDNNEKYKILFRIRDYIKNKK